MTDSTVSTTARLALKQAAMLTDLLPEALILLRMYKDWDTLAGPALETLVAAPPVVREQILATLTAAMVKEYDGGKSTDPFPFWKAVLLELEREDFTQGVRAAQTPAVLPPAPEAAPVTQDAPQTPVESKQPATRKRTPPSADLIADTRAVFVECGELIRVMYADKKGPKVIVRELERVGVQAHPSRISELSTDYALRRLDTGRFTLNPGKATELLLGLRLLAEESATADTAVTMPAEPVAPPVPTILTPEPVTPPAVVIAPPARIRASQPLTTVKERRTYLIGLRNTSNLLEPTFKPSDLMKPFGMTKLRQVTEFLSTETDICVHMFNGTYKFTSYGNPDSFPKH
jgi:hypothetical protein